MIKYNANILLNIGLIYPVILKEIKIKNPNKYEGILDIVVFKEMTNLPSPLKEDAQERIKFAKNAQSLLKDYEEEFNTNM